MRARPALLIAAGAVQLAAQFASAAFFRRHPQAYAERRLVADVLPVPAHQIGHPIAVLVQMKSDDLLLQRCISIPCAVT